MYELLILGVLTSRDMSGYKLRCVLESALVPRRPVSNGVMYPVLKKLAEQGFIVFVDQPNDPRGKRLAHITDAGMDRVQELMRQPVAEDGKRESIYRFKFRGMSAVDAATQERILADYEASNQTDRNVYQEVWEHLQDKLHQSDARHDALTWGCRSLELGIAICDAKQAWIDQCRVEMSQGGKHGNN